MTAPDVTTVFAASLKRLRTGQGWTLKELARRSGVAYASISAIEGGDRGARMSTADALARALGTTLAAMLTEEADRENLEVP